MAKYLNTQLGILIEGLISPRIGALPFSVLLGGSLLGQKMPKYLSTQFEILIEGLISHPS